MASVALVAISFVLVFSSSLILFHLYRRMNAARYTTFFWLMSGAFVFSIGVWSMHFVALLAYPFPVKVMYHFGYVFLSMGVLVVMSAIALLLFERAAQRHRTSLLVLGILVQTGGIVAMHYIGMKAIKAHATLHYQSSTGFVSIIVLALVLGFVFTRQHRLHKLSRLRQFIHALSLSAAVEFLHYSNMPMMHGLTSQYASESVALSQNQFFLAISISLIVSVICMYSIVILMIDSRLKQSEERLKRMNEAYSHILDSVAEGIYRLDERGKVIFWNQAAANLTGFEANEVLGRKVGLRAIKPEEEEWDPVEKVNRSGNADYVADDLFRRKNGSTFPVEYHITPMRVKGEQAGVVINFTDLTQRKEQESFLVESEKLSMAGQLAAGIAHEIRNPLTAIKGFMKLFQNGMSKMEYVAIITSEVVRMEGIINELLLLAKPQISRFQATNLGELLAGVYTLLESQANLNNVDIKLQFSEPELLIYCDESQIKQVFINLIKNAIEATEGGGEIRIVVEQVGNHIMTSIADYGCGIPQELLDQVGRPFFTTKEQGTGLGLMISNKIISSHGGTISISSKMGEGTTFQVTLPGGYRNGA
ncbi:ATP-binding protein [Paenibacillus lignilyticus]|uniref:histidine kinase n=1 Tax=Paenibacillus lignilyticus TaxID=1172615 RepID=A0ABS5C7D2_9BACL|nr:ATP-binding protein [Paenibacillus lignilyticus]MBP3961870.1 PAS domain S-box protein [Paenibacillus lignilyticus]MBP3963459.1 PAS domain S-box protein [Paenibacillus lignilyticus]